MSGNAHDRTTPPLLARIERRRRRWRRAQEVIAIAGILLVSLTISACASAAQEERAAAVKLYIEAVNQAREGDINAATDTAEAAHEVSPGFLDVVMLLARLAEERGDLEAAREHYLDILATDPTATDAGVAIALTYVRQGHPAQARPWLEHAVRADPAHQPALYNLAAVTEDLGELGVAATYFTAAARLDPTDPRPHVRIARIRARQERMADAWDHAAIARALMAEHEIQAPEIEAMLRQILGLSGASE